MSKGLAMDGIWVNSAKSDSKLVVTVRLCGDIDTTTTGILRSVLVETIMRRGASRVVIDLREVTALDSAAIGTLRAAYDAAHDVRLDLSFHTRDSPAAPPDRPDEAPASTWVPAAQYAARAA